MIVDIHPAPGRPTGMFLTINENDTAIFTVFGIGGNEPRTDLKSMLGYAENTLPLGFLTQCEPQSPSGTLTGTESPPANGGATTRCADSPMACW